MYIQVGKNRVAQFWYKHGAVNKLLPGKARINHCNDYPQNIQISSCMIFSNKSLSAHMCMIFTRGPFPQFCEDSCWKEDQAHQAGGGGGLQGMKAVIKAFVSSEPLEQH